MQVRGANLLKQFFTPSEHRQRALERRDGGWCTHGAHMVHSWCSKNRQSSRKQQVAIISTAAIGAAKGSVGGNNAAFTEYLFAGKARGQQLRQPSDNGVIQYYADTVEGPGIWNGTGARHLGLEGQIDRDDFESVLNGRHHLTGERLISARGSAGRAHLKVGEPTRQDEQGKSLWDINDAAKHFEIEVGRLAGVLEAETTSEHRTEIDGTSYLNYRGMEALSDFLDDDEEIRYERIAAGDGKELLSTKQVAELVGVSQRHIQQIGKYFEANRQSIDNPDPDNPIEHKQWIRISRGGREARSFVIAREDVLDYLDRREPPAVRSAYDATLSVEKSISIVALLSRGDLQDEVMAAYEAANKVAIDHLNEHASDGRAKGGAIGTEGLTIASFVHSTTRTNDPSLHTHNVVMNAVVDENGEGRTPDGRLLYTVQAEAASLATAELRYQLQDRLGFEFYQRDNGVWEIDGIPEELITEFSQRSHEIEAALDGVADLLGTQGKDIRQALARQTKAAKDVPEANELLAQWWARAEKHGFTHADLEATQARHQRSQRQPGLARSDKALLFQHMAGPQGATADTSVFSYSDAMKAINRWSQQENQGPGAKLRLRVLSADELKALTNEWLATAEVIPVAERSEGVRRRDGRRSGEIAGREAFTTKTMVRLQERIWHRWEQGADPQDLHGVADLTAVDTAISEHATNNEHSLTDEQQDLVRSWTQSGQQAQAAVGRPGTGKTTTMQVAVKAWRDSGYEVVGASVKGEAARLLGAEAGIDSHTVASYLHNSPGAPVITKQTVLLVDEASTLSDRELGQLLDLTQRTGATVRFIGDPAQHSSVEAGGMWNQITECYSATTPELTKQHRLRQDHEAQAVEHLRQNEVAKAFEIHAKAGTLIECNSAADALQATVRRAIDKSEAGAPHPIIERRNDRRSVINHVMQTVRHSRGHVQTPVAYGNHQFGIGDLVTARLNSTQHHVEGNKDLYVRNGSSGEIIAANPENVTVDFGEGLGHIAIDATNLRNGLLDLAYSVTSYAVQGATMDYGTPSIGPGASTNEVLVNLSRAREETVLTLYGNDDNEFIGFTEADSRGLTEQVVASIKPNEDRPATIVDPTLGPVANADQNLRQYLRTHRQRTSQNALSRRVDHINHTRLARTAVANSKLEHAKILPPRPTVPHLAKRWDKAAIEVATYNGLYSPQTSNRHHWGTAIGKRPTDPSQRAHWDNATTAISEAAQALTARTLTALAVEPAQTSQVLLSEGAPNLTDLKAQADAALQHQHNADAAVGAAETSYIAASQTRSPSRLRPNARQKHATMIDAAHTVLDGAKNAAQVAANQVAITAHAYDAARRGDLTTNPAREATIAHQTLTDPPEWLHTKIDTLSATGALTDASTRQLARWATAKATYLERWECTTFAPPVHHTSTTHQLAEYQRLDALEAEIGKEAQARVLTRQLMPTVPAL